MEIGYKIQLEKSNENHKSSHRKKRMKVLSNIKIQKCHTISLVITYGISHCETKPFNPGIEAIVQFIHS